MTTNPLPLKSEDNLLNQFNKPGSSACRMIEQIGNQLITIMSSSGQICAFSEHQNGLSVLRFGEKPTKRDGAKQTFRIPMEWNRWAEENGIGNQVTIVRFIVQGEILPEAENLLNSLITAAEELSANAAPKTNSTFYSKRKSTQIKWGIVAAGPQSHRLLADIELFGGNMMPVLITGETGCGKELVANALHSASRLKGRFFAVNCAAIPKELIESELFGHTKGSFTGATNARDGYFQAANGGTLFLDEIGELSLELQAKLLRALQEKKVRRVGSNHDEEVKIRVVAATNRDLQGMVKAGEFRADLFYRLNCLILKVAPLRERSEEIPQMVEFLLEKLSEELHYEVKMSPTALERLMLHDFPGNVRELVNLLEAGAVYAANGTIQVQHLRINGEIEEPTPTEYDEEMFCGSQETEIESDMIRNNLIVMFKGKTYEEIQEEVNTAIFSHALKKFNGQINRAAASLGMERSTFSRQATKMGLISKEREVINLPIGMGNLRGHRTAAQAA